MARKGSIIQGLSGIDIALWGDLKGKFFNQPILHRLMGGPRCEPR